MGVNLVFFDTFWLVVGTLTIGWNGGVSSSGRLLQNIINVGSWCGNTHDVSMFQEKKCQNTSNRPCTNCITGQMGSSAKGHHTSIRPCMK